MTRDEKQKLYRLARWQKMRARHLRANPLCAHCQRGKCYHRDDTEPCFRAAGIVDHIKQPSTPAEFWDTTNHQSLCRSCHDDKTRIDLGGKARPKIGLDGFPIE